MSILIGWFGALLVVGVPIAFVLGIAATAYLVSVADLPLNVVPRSLFAGVDRFVLMSIPFFILAGLLMNEAQLTSRLIQFANHLVGRWRGGLAQVNVVTSMFFGGITGAASADTAAVGSILIPAMTKAGYRADFATAVTVASSIVGPLIPPSIPMLIYGIASGASIGGLFLAGVTPGFAAGFAMLALNRYLLRDRPGVEQARLIQEGGIGPTIGFFASLRAALVALAMPIIIVGGVVGGVFTPTESSATAVVYALIAGFALRSLSLGGIRRTLAQTAVLSATVMLIIATANLLGRAFTFEQLPQQLAEFFLSVTDNRFVFLLFVALLLLIIGLFMETSGAIIILVPVLLPTALAYGFDVVHFGVVVVFGLVIGLITPPVGLCLFIGSSIGKVPIHVLSRALLPYIGLLIVLFLIFAFFPAASMWLPNLLR